MITMVCDECFEYLARKHSCSLASWWMDLCMDQVHCRHGHFWYLYTQQLPSITEDLKQLEDLGFIATHENDKNIIVKLLGYDESDHSYCIQKHM